jgi:amino acid transporter
VCFHGDGLRHIDVLYLADQVGIPDKPTSETDPGTLSRVPAFLSAYIPIPFFIILTVGYKLVHQTRIVPLNKMTFSVENVPEVQEIPPPKNFWKRVWYTIV